MFNPRVGEIRKITAVLDAEHEDIESLARLMLVDTADIVFARETWIVVVSNSLGLFVYGPYWTRKQADNAMLTVIPEPGPDKSRVLITKLIGVNDD